MGNTEKRLELWRPVAGYEGFYEVSNLGRVRSVTRIVKTSRGNGIKKHTGKILSPCPLGDGYLAVDLSKEGKRKKMSIHRLVAEAFISNPHSYPWVNHKDENKSNNCVDNLEWCTAQYNTNYGTSMERARPQMAKRKKKKVAQYVNGYLIAVYNSIGEAAITVKSDPGHIGDCCNGKRKTAAGYQWQFIKEE